MIDAFVSYLKDLDLELFQAINAFCGQNLWLDHIANRLDSLQLKGLAFMGTFGALWFQPVEAQGRRRETLVLALLAVVLSLVVARALADLLPFRPRPMFTSGIGYRAPLIELGSYFEDWSSFPSDTAAVVFVQTTGFWLLSRWWGLLWACFAIAAMTARIYFGLHYPADVLVGASIGIGVTIALNNEFMHARIASRIVAMEQRAPAIFYGILLSFIYEISTLFSITRSFRHLILRLFFGLGS